MQPNQERNSSQGNCMTKKKVKPIELGKNSKHNKSAAKYV